MELYASAGRRAPRAGILRALRLPRGQLAVGLRAVRAAEKRVAGAAALQAAPVVAVGRHLARSAAVGHVALEAVLLVGLLQRGVGGRA